MFSIITILSEIANDTLKKDVKGFREWSRTSLTMFTAWVWVVIIATIDYFNSGFKFEVWVTMVAVALGIKITDAYTKRIGK
jgi:hypothetical protein